MTLTSIILILGVCFIAYANGANDNFKGVATLFGSNTLNYPRALTWATITTFAGSLCSLLIAESLAIHFSGKGLVPPEIAQSTLFLQAVVFGAGLCVWIATLMGLPISTTHALVGALVGAGFMAAGTQLDVLRLGTVFLLPLLLSPFIALLLAAIVYQSAQKLRTHFALQEDSCVCIEENPATLVAESPNPAMASSTTFDHFTLQTGECDNNTQHRFGIRARQALNFIHYLSAGGVCFARGLNDTPKIVAALLAAKAAGIQYGLLLVALFMAAGGILQAKKVAYTMSKKITPLNEGQGLSANMVTFFLVVIASRFGMPVSTTHVSVGAIFGIGLTTGQADKRAITTIITAWFATLPTAALLAALCYTLLQVITPA